MKKIFKTFALAVVAAISFAACNKETEVAAPAQQDQVFTFAISENSGATKSILGSDENGRFVQFDSDDNVYNSGLGCIAPNAQGFSKITPASGNTPITFSIYTKGVVVGDKITVWYPYRSKQTDATDVELVIPAEQTHKSENAFDMKAMPMVTKQIVVDADMVAATSGDYTPVATINFANMGSLLNFKVFSTNDLYAGEKVKSITFNAKNEAGTADANIGGTFTKNLAKIDPDDESTMAIGSFTSGVSSIVTTPYADAAIGTSKANALDLYMVVAPGTYKGTIVVKTDAAEYTYTITNAAQLGRSKVKAYGLDLGSATAVREAGYSFTAHDFELASSIAVGDIIIITNGTSGNVAVMKHYEGSNNNYKKVDAAVSSTITSTEDMAVLTVGGEAGNLTLYDPATKLYVNATNTTSKNYLRSSDAVDDYAKWNITFSGSEAVITNTGKESHNNIRYNSAVDQLIFSAYDSGKQQPVYVFKQAAPKVLDHITLSGTYPTEFFVGDAFDYTGLVVTAHYTNGMSATVNPTSVSTPDMSAEDVVTVTVSYTENEITKTATYDIIITERGAYTVILGDDATELTESAAGAGVVLPTRSAIGDSAFYGWSETEVTTETSTAPTLVTVTGGKYYPTEDIILYPVYKKGSVTTTWVKTALNNVTAGEYILVTNDGTKVFDGTMTNGHGQVSSSAISFVGESATTIPSDACILTLASVTGGFTMYNADKGYLYASKAGSGGLAWHESEDSHWSYTSDNWRYSKAYSSKYAYIRSYNNSSFRTYATNSGDLPILAKKTTVNTETYISVPTE